MPRTLAASLVVAALAAGWAPRAADAQTRSEPRPWGHVSFYMSTYRFVPEAGEPMTSSEVVTAVTYQTGELVGPGVEYALDARRSQQTMAGRDPRVSVYNAYVGASVAGGTVRLRGGQMWLPELGGLGSVSGGLVEIRRQSPTGVGRFRAGAFAGVEPETHQIGFVRDVRKFGGYAALEGARGRRHVAGFVRLMHGGVAERQVVTFSNFIPAGSRFFLYQVGEYDLSGPAGQGDGRLSFLLVNGRARAGSRVELQGSFHRGRSIDARSITDDILNGRPVATAAAEGYFYESLGSRVTVLVTSRTRVHGGYTRDRNNRDSAPTGRTLYGVSSADLAGTGVDVTVSGSRIERPTGRNNSLYASVGRQVGRKVYVSVDYISSLSVIRFTRFDGLTVELRPETIRVGGSAVITLGRHVSILATAEQTRDNDSHEFRLMSGLTYRFR